MNNTQIISVTNVDNKREVKVTVETIDDEVLVTFGSSYSIMLSQADARRLFGQIEYMAQPR